MQVRKHASLLSIKKSRARAYLYFFSFTHSNPAANINLVRDNANMALALDAMNRFIKCDIHIDSIGA